MTIAVYRTEGGHVLIGLPGCEHALTLSGSEAAELYLALGASKPVTPLTIPAICHAPGDRSDRAACGAEPPSNGEGLLTSVTWQLVTCSACLATAGRAGHDAEPEAVWSLRRIYDTLDRLAVLGDEDASRERQTANRMLAWHADYEEQEASTTVAADPVDLTYLRLLGAREYLCLAQTDLPVVAWRAQLGEAIRRIDGVGARACPEQWSKHDRTDQAPSPLGPQEPPIATGDDPAAAAMVVALVAVIRSGGAAVGLTDAINQARRAVGMAGPGLYEDAADYEAVIRQALGR